MNLTVKTLKGAKFVVEAEPSNTVGEVKTIIETSKSEFPAANMKLIHSGKVLKDDVTVESCNIKPNDFLVCMITKSKKKAAAAPAAAAAPTPATSTEAPATTSSTTSTPAAPTATPASATPTTTTNPPTAAPPAPAPARAPPADEFPAEVISNLTGMGFPEAEARACLRAAHGNPDIAVEFLMNGIPPVAQPVPAPVNRSANSGEPLAALRNHPQFDALRRLVQSNPQALQAVLSQIGEQQPSLLQEINANQPLFLQMMNEPVSDAPAAPAPPPNTSSTQGSSQPGAPGGSRLGSMLGGGANPAQMAQMLSGMNPTELNEMAAMMGLTPEQLTATARMIGQMPPEQFQDFVSQALQQEGSMGMDGGVMPGQHVLRLSEEEMAAVDRLTEMGFDRSEAAQAFLACDKNEALAANLLMDSAGDFGMGGGGGAPSGSGDGGNADDGDDMYD